MDYEAIVLKHELCDILAGGDLHVAPDGNIAITPDGDLQFGKDRCNALHRSVRAVVL
jgi:hypothetical protein